MRLRTAALLAGLGLGLCFGTLSEPEPTPASMKFGQEEQVQEATNVAPAAPELADSFYVNFEIIVFQHEIDQYPVVWENLQKAIDEWSSHLPIRWIIFFEDSSNDFSILGRIGAIEIRMADMQAAPYHLSDNLLGMWQPHRGRILLDADYLEQNPEKAYSVSLHEMGHMFGLPHIIGFSEMGHTGFIVLPEGHDATNYVMYPRSIVDKPQKSLSPIEIKLARQNLVYHWTRPDVTYKECDCELYIED
ncbi:MAG: hypothetical protein K5880_13895 [Hydrogenophaga sp.]|uniref:hypothetical protein n=1 Tax=Hydrogenophaga sp. TaxID=1904254 RepID=UPI0026298138|nr:hypothetical protein [Hydrogenophaga sp.]MCV0439714.1 hypothetical protein [Hydrogenophaga sp.]